MDVVNSTSVFIQQNLSITAKISGNVYGRIMYVLRVSACAIHYQAQIVKILKRKTITKCYVKN